MMVRVKLQAKKGRHLAALEKNGKETFHIEVARCSGPFQHRASVFSLADVNAAIEGFQAKFLAAVADGSNHLAFER